MQKWDLVIADVTCPQPYEKQTLDLQALGGTEATVIRVAEGLGSLGAKVCVLQHNLSAPLMGVNAFYLPLSMIDEIDCYNFVALRSNHFFEKFPKAKKYSWHEDVGNAAFASMRDSFVRHNVTVIAASKWHKGQLSNLICHPDKTDNPRVVHIYNPVEDELFVPKSIDVKYDRNKLSWVASPHKGLMEAVDIFNRLIEVSGNRDFRLYTFNPGYMGCSELFNNRYLVDIGPIPCKEMWQHVSESLCLFYPTQFEETFGNIAAEANAVHTPVLTCEIAALQETVSSHRQFVRRKCPVAADKIDAEYYKAVIDRTMEWYNGDRPRVWGNDDFRLSTVLGEWIKLLSGRQFL